MSRITPSQTVGPYYAYCLTPSRYPLNEIFGNDLTTTGLEGERIRIEGRVIDGDNAGIPDAMIEIWQADAKGRFDHAVGQRGSNVGFKGFGRVEPAKDGGFAFTTIKPGRVNDARGRPQAPHIDVSVFARGMLRHLMTRIYFSDEASNADDPTLALLPEDRRKTLIAQKDGAVYRFDIRIQEGPDGPPETVFFAA